MNLALASASSENLISFVLVSSSSAKRDLAALRLVSDYAANRFDFFEILILAAAPGGRWLDEIKRGCGNVTNLRCIVFEDRQEYDELVFQGLAMSIGDIVYCDSTITVSEASMTALLAECLDGGFDVVKSVGKNGGSLTPGNLAMKLIRISLRAFLGRQIETDVQRAVCLTRSAAARIGDGEGANRYFRLISLADQFKESHVTGTWAKPRTRFDGFARKVQIAAFLVSTAAPRLLAGTAVFTLALCLLSLSYTVYSLIVWLVLDSVSEGWTSLSLVLSVLFAANFGVLAAVAIGILHVLRNTRHRAGPLPALEINNADLFAHATNFNVEIENNA